jgi:2-keto-4-pentenoate hydratase/2-oxohepta-3-ene-1,7-dioic acid hydratase in catechol pathway
MSTNVIRAEGLWFVEREGRAVPVKTSATTTAELLADRGAVDAAASAAVPEGAPRVADLVLQSPVTTPCRVVAQAVNYRTHAQDSGFDPAKVPTTFFRKASASVSGPTDPIVKPAHVRLLDYEVELGLVFGATMPIGTRVTPGNIADFVAGLVVTNDVSARDVQLPQTQFYEGKSYPTFTPVGPRLTLVTADELSRLVNLRLQLRVNGVMRQDRTAADMITPPAEALTKLARFQPMEPGDLLLTGTPGGTALKAPPHVVEVVAAMLPTATKWRIFFDKQAKNPDYLRAGDIVTASIATGDGTVDLGTQVNVVRDAT